MAKRIKFALEMKDSVQVRNLDDLRKHFDLDKTIGYFVDGKLLKWLEDRYYDEEAEAISALSKDDSDFNSKICKILGVEYEDEDLPEIDPEEIERRNERIAKLKQYTADTKILDKVDLVAFDQEELADLLDEEEPVIYLCQNKFTIPLREKNKKYVGIGKVEVVIRSKTRVDFQELNIQFENVHFNAEYEKLIKKSPDELLKQGEQAEEANDYDKALEFYKKAADMGNAEAMYYIANIYYNEDYDEYDAEKSATWIKKSAEAGYAEAMGDLGLMYECGEGVEENLQSAKEWYIRGSKLGDSNSMNNLGSLYESEADYSLAINWYQKAADCGNDEAMKNLGMMYSYGKGVEENNDIARKWWIKAANAGNTTAMSFLGLIYELGTGVNQNLQTAIDWYTKGAQLGNADCMNSLGNIYRKQENYLLAMEWYTKAVNAEDENSDAMNSLGLMYYNGEGVSEDEETAKKWFIRAAENNNISAINNLGWLYKQDEDYVQSVYWYQKSAQKGNEEGMFELGCAYDFGRGLNQNKNEAFKWYEKAAEKGHNQAMGYLGYAYRHGEGTEQNYQLAMEWYTKAAENDENAFVMKEIGDMYRNSEGVFKSYKKASIWYEKAANGGNTNAMLSIGYLYDIGKGVKANTEKAIYWYERAANEGNNSTAMGNLGYVYEKLENYQLAIEWYLKAIENNNEDVILCLGRSYRAIGNYFEAMKWLQQAASNNIPDAMNYIGLMYSNGEGVPQNTTTALNWYKKAARLGLPVAMSNIGYIYEQQENYNSAIEWYLKTVNADNCDDDVMCRLGRIYRKLGNYNDAMKWFNEAEKLCNFDAMNMLGLMYSNGEGVEKNSELAIHWYKEAADGGLAVAMYNLGYEYRYILKDYQQAFYWYQQAANTRYISAMTELGDLYYNGLGVAVNKQKALELYKEAADNGDENAIKTLEKIKTVSSATKSDGCFITTAVCDSFHKPDNCYELTMFRAFRDNWLKKQTDGQQLIAQYYAIAPKIVKNIDKLADADEIYLHIWNKYLKSCLSYIEHGKNEQCKSVYVKMVQDLYKKYLN